MKLYNEEFFFIICILLLNITTMIKHWGMGWITQEGEKKFTQNFNLKPLS
jgi:hypothetical protein